MLACPPRDQVEETMVLRALIVGLTLSALAMPAFAQQNGWYLGLRAGATWLEDANNTPVAGSPAAAGAAKTSYNTGYNGGRFVGYALAPLRLEGHVTYRHHGVSRGTPPGRAL